MIHPTTIIVATVSILRENEPTRREAQKERKTTCRKKHKTFLSRGRGWGNSTSTSWLFSTHANKSLGREVSWHFSTDMTPASRIVCVSAIVLFLFDVSAARVWTGDVSLQSSANDGESVQSTAFGFRHGGRIEFRATCVRLATDRAVLFDSPFDFRRVLATKT